MSSIASSYERLSSGLRINTASDDAAGLAVAQFLRADSRIYSQGVRNLSDGLSALNIADGSLSNLSAIVTRLQELAEQAANGSVGSQQRKSIDAEAQGLAKEYFRIAKTTDFNGLNLFDGSVQGLVLQGGYGAGGALGASLGGFLGTGTFGAAASYQTETGGIFAQSLAIATADINGDGFLDMVTSGQIGNGPPQAWGTTRLGNGDGTFRAALSFRVEGEYGEDVCLADINGDAALDIVIAGNSGGTGHAYARLGNGDGSFRSSLSYQTDALSSFGVQMSDLNADGLLDLVTSGYDGTGGTATIRIGNGDGTFRAVSSYRMFGSADLSIADVNGDGICDIVTAGSTAATATATIRLGNGDGTFRSSLSYQGIGPFSEALALSDLNGDGSLDLVTAGTDGTFGTAGVRLGNGDGTFRAPQSYRTENNVSWALRIGDIDGDGVQDLVTAGSDGSDGYASIRLGNGDGTFRASLSYRTEDNRTTALDLADLNEDGVSDLVSAGSDFPGGRATIRLAVTRDGISPILPFSLRTQTDARQAIPAFKSALDRLSLQRGQIGAFQSRLASALNTLNSTVLEYKGAQSRVEDVDVAEESANLLRKRILQQAGQSVLSQANQMPQLALSLLKNT